MTGSRGISTWYHTVLAQQLCAAQTAALPARLSFAWWWKNLDYHLSSSSTTSKKILIHTNLFGHRKWREVPTAAISLRHLGPPARYAKKIDDIFGDVRIWIKVTQTSQESNSYWLQSAHLKGKILYATVNRSYMGHHTSVDLAAFGQIQAAALTRNPNNSWNKIGVCKTQTNLKWVPELKMYWNDRKKHVNPSKKAKPNHDPPKRTSHSVFRSNPAETLGNVGKRTSAVIPARQHLPLRSISVGRGCGEAATVLEVKPTTIKLISSWSWMNAQMPII